MNSLITYRPPLPPSNFDDAFAEFLRIDVANGDASPDTMRNYRNEVALWVAWCVEQNFDAATATVTHIKSYRQALIEGGYNPITIRWKLSILRRFYEAARNAGLRNDNPAAGVKSPRVRQAAEDFQVPVRRGTGQASGGDPRPRAGQGSRESAAAAQSADGVERKTQIERD
jgi:hypothetical protein